MKQTRRRWKHFHIYKEMETFPYVQRICVTDGRESFTNAPDTMQKTPEHMDYRLCHNDSNGSDRSGVCRGYAL